MNTDRTNPKTHDGKQISQHLLVENPYTGQHINLMPLFELAEQRDYGYSKPGLGEAVLGRLDAIIRYVAINIRPDASIPDVQRVNRHLYELRDMFEKMVSG